MVKILMVQDTKVKEIIKNDIWDTILETLDMGIRFGHGEDAIHITIGLLLLLSLAFLLTEILVRCAQEQKAVLKNPKPFVVFDDFGDSALIFSVHFFISDAFGAPRVQSQIRYLIDARFREHRVSIPFPQRDVHIYQSRPLQYSSIPVNTNGGGS